MNKEEILAKSREENKNGDEREKKSRMSAAAISAGVGALLCMILVCIEELVFDRNAIPLWIVYYGIQFTSFLVEYIKTKKRSALAVWIILALCLLIETAIYILECMGI